VNEPTVLTEYSTRVSVPISHEDAAVLGGNPSLTVLPSMTYPGTWDLTASHYVGVIRAGQTEVRIRPKVAMRNLLFLLGYARDPTGWGQIEASFADEADLAPALACGFDYHARRALAQGVLRGYVTLDDALPLVRGRIRTSDQMSRRHHFPIPVELTFDEFSPDILENRMLLTASRILLRLGGLPAAIQPRLRHLASRLDGVTELPVRRPVPTVTFGRINERYRAAVMLARLILEGSTTGDQVGGRKAVSFLFDMNRIFEDFVTATLASRFADRGFQVEQQLTDSLDEAGKISIRPDLSWWRWGRCVGVADVKYKSLSLSDLPNADVYQLLAYCVAHGVPRGFLIYAAGNESPDSHRIRNLDVEIEVVALDLDLRPVQLLEALDSMASNIVIGEPMHFLSA
jgi:5-methylcytosine-specific restriction enzyme subunit McrC